MDGQVIKRNFLTGKNIEATINYLIKNTVMVNLGTDILASHEDESATDPISEYRANNRIRAGVSYVF